MGKLYRCKYLSHGLYIDYNCLRHCHLSVHAPSERIPHNYIADYTSPDNVVIWDNVFELKNKLTNEMRNGNIPSFCRGCHHIEEFDENEQEKYSSDFGKYIDIIWIGHTNKCNIRCIYCSQYKKKIINGYNILPLFKEILEKKIFNPQEVPSSMISFSLGEPTILKNFNKILDMFYDKGTQNFNIFTNGTIYSPQVEKMLNNPETGVYVVISLDSGSKKIYKKIKNADKFEQVCNNLKKYALACNNVNTRRVGAKYIIIPNVNDTKAEIDKWFNICTKELGITFLIADVEEKYFVKKQGVIPDYIKKLLIYIRQRCIDENIQFDFYDRAVMLHL